MEPQPTPPPKRTRKRILLWIASIVALLLLIYSYRYDLILLLPSVQADRLQVISEKTALPFSPSSRVIDFSEEPFFHGPYPDWKSYWCSQYSYWEYDWENRQDIWRSWRAFGTRWYEVTDCFVAKVVIPDASYAEFSDALQKKNVGAHVLGANDWETQFAPWWKPSDIKLRKSYTDHLINYLIVIASKEDGHWAIYVLYDGI